MTKMLGRRSARAPLRCVGRIDRGGASAGHRARARHDRQSGRHDASVKGRDGNPVTVKLADDVKVLAVDRKSLADVKQGVFVGITAMPQPDGTQKAVEIHIFPEALRGTGKGHRPWDLMPNSTMTNANIESAVASSDGQEVVLKYKDGEKKFVVPANVEVVMFAPAAVADLKPGEKIFVSPGKKQPKAPLRPAHRDRPQRRQSANVGGPMPRPSRRPQATGSLGRLHGTAIASLVAAGNQSSRRQPKGGRR